MEFANYNMEYCFCNRGGWDSYPGGRGRFDKARPGENLRWGWGMNIFNDSDVKVEG